MTFDVQEFWNKKIIGWEEGRYSNNSSSGTKLLERLANSASTSLRFRMEVAAKLLAPHVANKKVLEIGGGSGLLTKSIMDATAASYLGVDIAPIAIKKAKERNLNQEWSNQVVFEVRDLDTIPIGAYDIVVSLGLVDWLNDIELELEEED